MNEYRDNKNLKANSSQEKIKKNVETIQNLQKDLNTILQNNIKNYNEYPENINQKLNANMVFELTDNEAKEIKKIISFEKMYNLRNRLQKWNANYLTSFSKTESINPQEFIPLLSIYYQRPARFNPESGLILLQKALKDKNRFLAWFSVRYYADIRQFKNPYYSRRIQEAAMFGLNNKDSNNQIEYFSTSLDIFSYLNFNFKEANAKQGLGLPDTYTYLSFMQTYGECKTIDETAKNRLKEYNIYHTKDKHYYAYVGKDEFQDITNILSPYLDYLNTLTQKTFSLENIYCIQSFYGNLGAKKLTNVASINKILSQRFSNNSKQPQPTQDSTAQANPAQSTNENLTQILILYPTPTPLPIQIIQPQNTFLTLVLGKNAKLDCSKLIVGQCAILYLEYDEKEKESTQNPKLTALKSNAILTLNTQDSITYETSHNNILYTISKNDGVLRVSLQGNHKPNQDQEEIQENQETTQSNAIELYNFAKENEYRILKDSPSQMLDIQLKLQDNKELDTSHNGNFSLTINNLTLLDSKGKNLDITTKQDFTLYLHNCENRQVYTSTTITKNPNSDTYSTTFHFDLILEQTSNLFKRTTKLIVATQNLANDFSTSEIHSKGNVAIISLRSADKKGGSYTFSKRVSAQEFESQAIHTRNQYLASNDDSLAYEVAFGDKTNTIQIFNKEGIYLFSIERKDRTETKLNTEELYGISGIQWFESSAENYHKLIDVNPDLQDKEKCEGLGVLYFTWRDIVEFAHENNGDLHWYDILFMTSMSNKLNYARNMPYDWKQSPKGARGFILVSMEGIPYWADAVGQIPYAIDVYRAFYRQYGNVQKARNGTIKLGYLFADGTPMNADNSNSYDNAMILRGINWAEKRYYKPTISDCFDEISIKNCGYKTLKVTDYPISNLSKDSNGKDIF